MAKGLLGGYKAKFSNAPFYRNTSIYSEKEMRDLWHYELALPDWERQRTLMTLEHADALQGKSSRSTRWNVQYRVALSSQVDIRVESQGDGEARELAAGMSWYF